MNRYGYPRGVIAVYDAYYRNPDIIDRYTVVYGGGRFITSGGKTYKMYECLGMDERPFHPQGFGQHSECQLGRHLGTKIHFKELPADCQRAVRQDLKG